MIKRLYKRIDNRLRQSSKRVKIIFSNVIAGVLSGGFVATILGTIRKEENVKWVIPDLFQIIVVIGVVIGLFLLLYSVGLRIIVSLTKHKKDKGEITWYNYNLLSGLISSISLGILFNIPIWWIRPLVAVLLAAIFVFILYLIVKK